MASSSSTSSDNESLDDSFAKKVLAEILDTLDPTKITETGETESEKSIKFINDKSDSLVSSQPKSITVPVEIVNDLKISEKTEKQKASINDLKEVLKQLEEIKVNEKNILRKLYNCPKEKSAAKNLESTEIVIRPKTNFDCESHKKTSKNSRDRSTQKYKERDYTFNVVLHNEDTKHTRDRKIFNKAEVESNHDIVDQKLKNLIKELEKTTFELKLYHIKYGIDEEIIKKVNNMRDYFEIELDLPTTYRLNPIIFDAYNEKLKRKNILIENLKRENKKLNLEQSSLKNCYVSAAKKEFKEAVICNSSKLLQDQIAEVLQDTINSIKRMEKRV